VIDTSGGSIREIRIIIAGDVESEHVFVLIVDIVLVDNDGEA